MDEQKNGNGAIPEEQDGYQDVTLERKADGTWAEGVSGNPNGRPKGAKSVLQRAKHKLDTDPDRANRIAEAWLDSVEANPTASEMGLLFDRQDGKVSQPVDMLHLLPQLALRDRTPVDPRLPPSVVGMEESDGSETDDAE